MAQKALKNFQQIFARNDFNYISELNHIDEISEIIFLVRPRTLYKDQVCFLCKVSDHDDYEERLDIPAKQISIFSSLI